MLTTINTPFGPMRLVVNNAESAVLTEPEGGSIRIHRTGYDRALAYLKIDPERRRVRFAAEPWLSVRISRVRPGSFFTRQDCTASALRLAIDTLPGVVERYLAEHPEIVDLAQANDIEERLSRALNERADVQRNLDTLNATIRDLVARTTGKD